MKPLGNDVVWRKVAMSQCHNPHFANLLRFAIAWRERDRFRSQRNHRFFRLPNFMSSEQPLVGEEHCVTTLITAAKETR